MAGSVQALGAIFARWQTYLAFRQPRVKIVTMLLIKRAANHCLQWREWCHVKLRDFMSRARKYVSVFSEMRIHQAAKSGTIRKQIIWDSQFLSLPHTETTVRSHCTHTRATLSKHTGSDRETTVHGCKPTRTWSLRAGRETGWVMICSTRLPQSWNVSHTNPMLWPSFWPQTCCKWTH